MPDQKSGDQQKDVERMRQNKNLLKMTKEDIDLIVEELGGEILEIDIISEDKFSTLGKLISRGAEEIVPALKTAKKVKAPELKLGKTAPGAIVKAEPPGKITAPKVKGKITQTAKTKPGAIVKYEPKTTAITKAKTKTSAITKTKTKTKTATKDLAKIQTGTLVKTDPKTGAIVSTGSKTKTQAPLSPPPPPVSLPSAKPGRGFNIPIPGLPKMKENPRDIGFVKTHQINK